MTLTQHGKTEAGKYELHVEIDSKEFEAAVQKAYNKNKNQIAIPGFRKGKVPRKMIEKMYGENFFYEDAINDLLPDAFDKALLESGIEMIGRPDVAIEDAGKDGAKLLFTVELRPELTVKKYKGISAHKDVQPVDEADVDAEIKRLSEKTAREVEVTDRAAQDGDIAEIDFEGFVDEVAFEGGKGEGYPLTLGSGSFIPGFEEQIVGHNVGEEFDVNVTFPEEYGAEELAGKAARFAVKLNALRNKEYPELDDEFAKDVSEYDTLDELKNSIREDLKGKNETAAENMFEDELADNLVKELEGEVPEVMIEARIDDMVRDFSYRMMSQGLKFEDYMKITGQDMAAVRSGLRDQAEHAVKMRLALEAVARAEKFEFTDEEVEAEYTRMSEEYNMDLERVHAMISPVEVKSDLAATKALDFVKENAKITKTRKKSTKKAKEAAEEPAEETATDAE